ATHPHRRRVSARVAALLPLRPTMRSPTMNSRHGELTLEEMLSDPIIRAVMEADEIDPQELAATLRQTGRMLARRTRPGGPQSRRFYRASRSGACELNQPRQAFPVSWPAARRPSQAPG